MRVDFPAPFSPRSTWPSPRATSSETPRSAITPGKRFPTPLMLKIGMSIARLPGPRRETKKGRGRTPAPSVPAVRRPRLCEILGLDQLDRRLDPSAEFLAGEFLEAVVDAEHSHVGAVLFYGRQHLAALDQRLHRRDVVEADDLDLAAEARGV